MEERKLKKRTKEYAFPWTRQAGHPTIGDLKALNIPDEYCIDKFYSQEKEEKIFDEENDTPKYYDIWFVVVFWMEPETDAEFLSRKKKEEAEKKFWEEEERIKRDKERLLYLSLKAKYENETGDKEIP